MDTLKESSSVDSALLRYFDVLEQGGDPDTEALTATFSNADRARFLDTLGAVLWARNQLPRKRHRAGLVVGRYELRGEIGSGGFGSVWRALDQNLEREVAIKFVEPGREAGGDLARLRTEVRTLARSRCGGVARVLDVGVHEGQLFLVLELVQGRSLACILEDIHARTRPRGIPSIEMLRTAIRFPCDPGSVDLLDDHDWYRVGARITSAILRTIESIHFAGIRHRDIKPSNVMLRGCGQPVLVDFGLAAICDARAESGAEGLSGSLPYMAPEQLEARCTGIDGRTDVYQVGLLLYEILTLRPAFGPDLGDGTIDAIRSGRFPRPREVRGGLPRDLEDICLRALERAPELRYQTAESFRADLEHWLGGVVPPVAIRGTGPRSWLRRAPYVARRNARLLLALSCLSLGAAFGACLAGGVGSA